MVEDFIQRLLKVVIDLQMLLLTFQKSYNLFLYEEKF